MSISSVSVSRDQKPTSVSATLRNITHTPETLNRRP